MADPSFNSLPIRPHLLKKQLPHFKSGSINKNQYWQDNIYIPVQNLDSLWTDVAWGVWGLYFLFKKDTPILQLCYCHEAKPEDTPDDLAWSRCNSPCHTTIVLIHIRCHGFPSLWMNSHLQGICCELLVTQFSSCSRSCYKRSLLSESHLYNTCIYKKEGIMDPNCRSQEPQSHFLFVSQMLQTQEIVIQNDVTTD